MDSYSNGGKTGLILDLKAKGFSVRRSTKAVNAFFECMRQALARGETVEVPGDGFAPRSRRASPTSNTSRSGGTLIPASCSTRAFPPTQDGGG